jgi:hypothetical protein
MEIATEMPKMLTALALLALRYACWLHVVPLLTKT